MSGRGFRLAAVERLRSARLGESGQALARARHELATEVAHRADVHRHLLQCVPGGRETPSGVQLAAHRRELLRDRLVASDARVEQLQQQADAARTRWLAARADLRAVEVLHERYRAALRREQDRRDQRALDELASSRHRTPQDPGPDAGVRAGQGGEPVGGDLPADGWGGDAA